MEFIIIWTRKTAGHKINIVITLPMTRVFRAKLRSVGNSLGLIAPSGVVKELDVKSGDTVEVSIPCVDRDKRNTLLVSLAGMDRGAEPFEREREDRF